MKQLFVAAMVCCLMAPSLSGDVQSPDDVHSSSIRIWLPPDGSNYLLRAMPEDQRAAYLEGLGVRSLIIGTMGASGPPRQEAFDFSGLDRTIEKIYQAGATVELVIKPQLGRAFEDAPPQGEETFKGSGRNGQKWEDVVDIFNPKARDLYLQWIEALVQYYGQDERLDSFALYGTTGLAEWGYPKIGHSPAAYSPSAIQAFRTYLSERYDGDIEALNSRWGTGYASFEEIDPPVPMHGVEKSVDRRPEWMDFIAWYVESMDAFLEDSLQTIRPLTDKPLGVMFGGQVMGMFFANSAAQVGPVLDTLSRYKPTFFKGPALELFPVGYQAAASRWYGVEFRAENPGVVASYKVGEGKGDMLVRGLSAREWMASWGLNLLAGNLASTHFMGMQAMLNSNGEPTELTALMASLFHLYRSAEVDVAPRSIAYLDCIDDAYYRAPRYVCYDAVQTYEKTLAPVVDGGGAYLSLGRTLGFPDVIDTRMVEDGALDQYQVLVIPQSMPAVLSKEAVEDILDWVRVGGLLIIAGDLDPACVFDRDEHAFIDAGSPLYQELASLGMDSPTDPREAGEVRPYGQGEIAVWQQYLSPALSAEGEQALTDWISSVLARRGISVYQYVDADRLNVISLGTDARDGKQVFLVYPPDAGVANETTSITLDPPVDDQTGSRYYIVSRRLSGSNAPMHNLYPNLLWVAEVMPGEALILDYK
ncbi:MAG: beta-galactosidase [Verrucomicrobiota bacterium JB024]|nr:beta-galactosidase [Verrucomicrobiota bacterium JB024]